MRQTKALLALLAGLLITACGGAGSGSSPSGAPASVDVGSGNLAGAGSTFTEPFYTKAFYQYSQLHSSVAVNYQPIGSGGGIQQFTKGTVDFGASDVPMTAAEVAAAGGADAIAEFPTTLGVAAIAYNLAGIDKLQLDGPTLAKIYLGQIKTWNDPALAALNGTTKLPGTPISVTHRSEGSGTSYAFTDYLSKQSAEWQTKVGVGKSVQWPTGIGANGNAGVANAVKTTDGAIGYVELAFVVQARMQQAYLKNKNGKFVQASLAGGSAAAAGTTGLSTTNFSITDAPGDTSYPIATFTWAIMKKTQADAAKGKALTYLMQWLVTGGQQYGKDLQYAPLPKAVSDLAQTSLKTVTANGAPILK
jgi:phosphate transport system substrate-binding protein